MRNVPGRGVCLPCTEQEPIARVARIHRRSGDSVQTSEEHGKEADLWCWRPWRPLAVGSGVATGAASIAGLVAFFALLACSGLACSGGGGRDDALPDAGRDDAAVEPEGATWTPDEAPEGAALWVDAEPAGDEVRVTISSRGLGAVFGLSAHLGWDEAVLALDEAQLATAQAAVLDPEADGQAVMLTGARPGDLALGGSRTSRAAGSVALDDEATLATLTFSRVGAGTTRLDLLRAVVARADGALSPVAVAGGILVLPEVVR